MTRPIPSQWDRIPLALTIHTGSPLSAPRASVFPAIENPPLIPTRLTPPRPSLVVQGTLSVLLLVGAGLFVRSLSQAQSLNLGIDPGRLLVVCTLRGDTPLRPDFQTSLRAPSVAVGLRQTSLSRPDAYLCSKLEISVW
jgi:hypothetical protein